MSLPIDLRTYSEEGGMLELLDVDGNWEKIEDAINTDIPALIDSLETGLMAEIVARNPAILTIARTSNTIITAANIGNAIRITSGTFTQTFDPVVDLGDKWFCYYEYAGTGEITIDPSGSETCDGLTNFKMYPGEKRLFMCDGTALRSIVLNPGEVEFTAAGTWTKPPGYAAFDIYICDGGCSGAARISTTATSDYGGRGGAADRIRRKASALSATESVVVGTGASARVATGSSSTSTAGTQGGISSFAGISVALNDMTPSDARVHSTSYIINAGSPTLVMLLAKGYHSGNGGLNDSGLANGWPSKMGGGGGAGSRTSTTAGTGGKSDEAGTGGTAANGNNVNATASAGSFPGGGGGSATVGNLTGTKTATSGAGADGVVRVRGII